jgi:hypothetical protein
VVFELLEFMAILSVMHFQSGNCFDAIHLHLLYHVYWPIAEIQLDVLFHPGIFIRCKIIILEMNNALLGLVSQDHVQSIHSRSVHSNFLSVSLHYAFSNLCDIKALFDVGMFRSPRSRPKISWVVSDEGELEFLA